MRNFIRNYPLSLIFTIFIWVICLIPIPETPLDKVRFIDKWTHITLYFVLSSVVAFEFIRVRKRAQKKPLPKQLVLWEWLVPILMGGLVEIAQATCTNGVRNGDWLDFLADATGSTLALVVGFIILKVRR